MNRYRGARIWFAVTLAVAGFALVVQLVLVLTGAAVLIEEDPPTLGERLLHLVSYFTIQANVAVWLSLLPLVRDPDHDGGGWRVLRLTALTGITITGVVLLGLVWPIAWLVYTLMLSAITGWYPYPFVDVDRFGPGSVAASCLLIALGFLALSALAWLGDRKLPGDRKKVAP